MLGKRQRWSENLLVLEASPRAETRCRRSSQGPTVQTGKLSLRALQAMSVWWSPDSNPDLTRSTAAALASQCMATVGPPGSRPGERSMKVGPRVPQWVSVSPWVPEGAGNKGTPQGVFSIWNILGFWNSELHMGDTPYPQTRSSLGVLSCLRRPEGG